MPELPEVETVRRGLSPVMVGARLVGVEQRRPDLRFPFPARFAERLTGREIVALDRRAKYLQARLDDGTVCVMHLGMSGSFRIEAADAVVVPGAFHHPRSGLGLQGNRVNPDCGILLRRAGEGDHAKHGEGGGHDVDDDERAPLDTTLEGPRPAAAPYTAFGGPPPPRFAHGRTLARLPNLGIHDHVVFTLSNGARIVYNDPRRFGFMLLVNETALTTHPTFRGLGLEPLGPELTGGALARLFAGRRTPLKAALLDQRLVAGLGNIYVCEALHRAGLSPRRAAGTLARRDGTPTARAVRLAAEIRTVLEEAVAAGGSSLRDHRQTDGSLGYFQHAFRVYDRLDDPCPNLRCSGLVSRIVQSGRSTFFCPVCQR